MVSVRPDATQQMTRQGTPPTQTYIHTLTQEKGKDALYALTLPCTSLHLVQIFIFAGVAYCYFLASVEETSPPHETAGDLSERRRIRTGTTQASEAMTPGAMGGLNSAALKEETTVLPQDDGEGPSLGQEAEGAPPAGKAMAAKKKVAGSPGWKAMKTRTSTRTSPVQGSKKGQREIAVYSPDTSEEEEHREDKTRGLAYQILRKLWPGWLPDSDILKTQDHE
ncbi:uncharacterized protein LOC132538015 isoform X2 [Erinaceus europaeus]|uniref:Uncharacterized protein LOC132538015 isoform X2 n=1 Tax=Erinaceus europaeus TaxID=9365 RepID=A0ABM3X886_ERIEU|nr:uncharacterized protein LOC132538015 isoform X2 [Erinaceus europaeus]